MAYWTTEDDLTAHEFDTVEQADEYFNIKFAEKCAEDNPRDGEEFEETMTLALYDYDEDKVLETRKITLFYEHCRDDYSEHNTHWGL